MRYVNAGHNMPFVLHADGRTEALESTGRPLGLLAGGGYQERRVALEAAACLFLYTDGVIESENAAGEPFGLERLRTLLVRERTSGLDGILSRVEEAVRAYRDGAEAADDATMVVLRVGRPPGVPAGPDGASRL
jgi:sigma-B regulation protein RsbU (phosphoserine phosphatase)